MSTTALGLEALTTGAAALLFGLVFLFGNRFHPFSAWVRDRRSVSSFGGGIAMAYVFVRVMPELQGARQIVATEMSVPSPFGGTGIYVLAMVGFLSFYGLEHLRRHLHATGSRDGSEGSFKLHVGAFAFYGFVVSYQLPEFAAESNGAVAFYAVAMSFHFLGVERHLREEHKALYQHTGRYVLATACAAGWLLSLLFSLPPYVLAIAVAFLSGAVILNSSLMELPAEQDGRFIPFLAGGLIYSLALLPLS